MYTLTDTLWAVFKLPILRAVRVNFASEVAITALTQPEREV